MNRLPGSQLLESNAAPATRRREEVATRSSTVLLNTSMIEPLAPLPPTDAAAGAQERRRSSSISFERHALSLFEDLAAELDAEIDDDDVSDTESDDDDDDSVNPTVAALLGTVQIHRRPPRRVSDLSLDLQDIREAVTELEDGAATRFEDDEEPQEEDVAMHYPRQGALLGTTTTVQVRRPSRRVSEMSLDLEDIREAVTEFEDDDNNRSSSNMSVMARAEEEILAKAVREGKLLVTHNDDSETGHGSSGSGSGRTSLVGRHGSIRSVLSGGSASTQSSRRSLKFRRTTATSRTTPPARGSVQDDIMTALSELQRDSDDVEPDGVFKAGETEKEEGPEQGGSDESSPGRRPLTLEIREASVPSPRGARPRRSSLRRAEDCVY